MRCHSVACGTASRMQSPMQSVTRSFSAGHTDAVIRVYDEADNAIETHQQTGGFKEPLNSFFIALCVYSGQHRGIRWNYSARCCEKIPRALFRFRRNSTSQLAIASRALPARTAAITDFLPLGGTACSTVSEPRCSITMK